MLSIAKRSIKRVLNPTSFQRYLIEKHGLATVLHWFSDRGYYLRRYSEFDTRYFRWLYCLELTRDLEGDIVELGVGPGRFLLYCATWLKATRSTKRYYGYDTFSGFPSVSEEDLENLAPERVNRVRPGVYGFYNRRRMEKMTRRLGLANVQLVEGDFSETLKRFRPDKVSFLYMDCDLYRSYKAGLEMLYDHVVPGGIILFDEYEWVREWPGARRAVDEFFQDKPEKPEKLPFSTSYFVTRGLGA